MEKNQEKITYPTGESLKPFRLGWQKEHLQGAKPVVLVPILKENESQTLTKIGLNEEWREQNFT